MTNENIQIKKVRFLGKEYEMPIDIIEYIDILNKLEDLEYELMNNFVNKLNETEARYVFTCQMMDDMKKTAGIFIERLCRRGIFNRTIDEYILENKGYKIIDEVNVDAKNTMDGIIDEELYNISREVEDAKEIASSKITGSGVRVYTRDLLGATIYCTMEASTLKKQEREARELYNSIADNAFSQGSERMGNRKNEYIKETYLPDMEDAIRIFVCDMMDMYINDLIIEGKITEEIFQYINIKKSCSLLENLTLSDDKKSIFECAFVECPFNFEVYKKLIDYDMFNEEIYSTVKYFGLEEVLKTYLEKNIKSTILNKNFTEDMNNISKYVKILAMCGYENESILIKKYANSFYKHIIDAYGDLDELLLDDDRCEEILDKISHKEFIEDGEKVLLEKSAELVNGIINSEDFLTLERIYGFNVILSEIIIENNDYLKDKDDIDNYFIEKIFKKLGTFLEKRKKVASEYLEEIDKKNIIKKNREEYEKSIQPKLRKILDIAFRVLLIFPIVMYIILVCNWKWSIKKHIKNDVESRIEEGLEDENSEINNIELTGKYKIEDIDYYDDGSSITIVPYIRVYSKMDTIYSDEISLDEISLLASELVDFYPNDNQVPLYIKYDRDIRYSSIVTVESKDGSTVVDKDFEEMEDYKKIIVFVSGVKILVYIMYLVIIYYIYATKKYDMVKVIAEYLSHKKINKII